MTSGFLFTVSAGDQTVEQARTFKRSDELKRRRTREKLAIERAYWYARGIDWAVVTEEHIPLALVENIKWVHPRAQLATFSSLSADDIDCVARALTDRVLRTRGPLARLCADCDDTFSLPDGTALGIARHLIATRQWIVDMHTLIDPAKPLTLHAIALSGET